MSLYAVKNPNMENLNENNAPKKNEEESGSNEQNNTKPLNSKEELYGYDPMLTVVKLATYRFYEKGTKLSFYSNKIYIQRPTITQGVTRYWYGDSKDVLVHLYVPLRQCINKYINKGNDPCVKEILKSTIQGIKQLQETYEKHTGVVLQLQLLIDMITDSLEGRNKDHSHLNKIFGDIDLKPTFEELWNDLSITVLSKHLSSCNGLFLKANVNGSAVLDKDFIDQKQNLMVLLKRKKKDI